MKMSFELYGKRYSVECDADDVSAEEVVDDMALLLIQAQYHRNSVAEAMMNWAELTQAQEIGNKQGEEE